MDRDNEINELKGWINAECGNDKEVSSERLANALIALGYRRPGPAKVLSAKQIRDLVFNCSDVSGAIDYEKLERNYAAQTGEQK